VPAAPGDDPSATGPGRLVVAFVRGLHGVRGAVRVEVLTDRPEERFSAGRVLFGEGASVPLTVVESRPASPGWILRFAEVGTRTAAEPFRDAYLEAVITPAERPPRGAYYWHEVIGCPVTDPAGGELGVVRDVYRSGGSEVLVVADGPRGDFDLPVARPFVRVLAPRRGEIVADPDALDLPALGRVPAPRAPRRRSGAGVPPAGPAASTPTVDAPPGPAGEPGA